MATSTTSHSISVSSSTPASRNNEKFSKLNLLDNSISYFFLCLMHLFLLYVSFIFIKDSKQTNIARDTMVNVPADGVPVKYADNLFSVVCKIFILGLNSI